MYMSPIPKPSWVMVCDLQTCGYTVRTRIHGYVAVHWSSISAAMLLGFNGCRIHGNFFL
jgi:hypothetical protein